MSCGKSGARVCPLRRIPDLAKSNGHAAMGCAREAMRIAARRGHVRDVAFGEECSPTLYSVTKGAYPTGISVT